ncbi:hypothetical protein [Actinoplanes regularis]|uniref:hypothetical protein n=1 Tax=Actinoplanes regularis TaxID=52697 RepID=UPI0024A530D3|nr:hypothetical protein [Actinoplanes regularis]GLW33029.1 hypothetical protein Areg01_59670 [Actinoplanes regularis]
MAEDGTGSAPAEPSKTAGATPADPAKIHAASDTGLDGLATGTGDTDKTEHAPLAQWAGRAGGHPQPPAGSAELQVPSDPWPAPIQGLGLTADQAAVDHLETLQYTPPPQLPDAALPPTLPATLVAGRDRGSRGLVAILVVTAAALLAGAVTLGALVRSQAEKRATDSTASRSSSTPAAGTTRQSYPASVPSTGATADLKPIPAGPVAQGVPPETVYEMDEICRGETYWPMLPKRAGKAPHPVLVYGDLSDGTRLPYTMFDTWFLKSKAKETAWSYDKPPTTIQLVACVDRVSVGAKVRSCSAGVLYRATYRLHAYETATGKKLLDTKIKASDTSCPRVDRLPDDKMIYMEPSESALVAALRKFVEK